MPNRKVLPFLSLIFVVIAVRAQSPRWSTLEVATDYNNCSVGVKDSTGRWVIEPVYEDISFDLHGYIVSSGGKYGLIDNNGKTMIPMMYDRLWPLRSLWWGPSISSLYKVISNGKCGLVDSVNNIIVPVRYDVIDVGEDSSILAGNGKRWEFYNLKGEHWNAPWTSKRRPTRVAPHLYSFRKLSLSGWKWGAVSDTGRVVLKQKYDDIEGYEPTGVISVGKRKHYGYCSQAGKMIWPIRFSYGIDAHDFYYSGNRLVGYEGVGPAILNRRFGLITAQGDTLLPFSYTRIAPFNEGRDHSLWVVDSNSYSGIYDIRYGWKVPLQFEEMITMETYMSATDSSVTGLLAGKRNNVYGAMTTSGQVIIPFRYTYMEWLSDNSIIFFDGDSVVELICSNRYRREAYATYLFRDSLTPDMVEIGGYGGKIPVPASGMFSAYNGKDGVRAYYNPALTHQQIRFDGIPYYLDKGDYRGLAIPDSIYFAAPFYVKTKPHVVMKGNGFSLYVSDLLYTGDTTHYRPDFAIINGKRICKMYSTTTSENRVPYYTTVDHDLLKGDGTFMVSGDTNNYLDERTHGHSGRSFFVIGNQNGYAAIDLSGKTQVPRSKKEIVDYNKDFCWYQEFHKHYVSSLYNLRTGKNALGKNVYSDEAHVLWDSVTIIEDSKHGLRLFNYYTGKYFTQYGFNTIAPIDSAATLFAVKTCTGHIGVMRSNGTWAQDTIYTAYTPAEYRNSVLGSSYLGENGLPKTYYRYYVFYNDQAATVIEPATGEARSLQQSTGLLWQTSLVTIHHKDPQAALRDSFYLFSSYRKFLSFYCGVQDSISLLPWQRTCIIDSMYTPSRMEEYNGNMDEDYPCEFCRKRHASFLPYEWIKNYEYTGDFMAEFHSDSVLSFYMMQPTTYFPTTTVERFWFSNVMLFPDGAHQLSVDSLFKPESDWRGLLINTVLGYVNSHLGIEGDCHNPAGIPSLLSQSFLISGNGLLLYPPGFSENGKQLVLTIPWKDADAYLRNDLRTRLPLNGK